MATYADLEKRVMDLINRTDCTNALARQFIQDALRKTQRTIRLPSLEKVLQISVGTTPTVQYNQTNGVVIIPQDFISMVYAYTKDGVIKRVPMTKFIELNASVSKSGLPKYYTRVQNTFHLKPIPQTGHEIDIVYQGEDDPLVNGTDTNTFSTVAPDLLVYGACIFAADYFNDERKGNFAAMYDQIQRELQNMVDDAESATIDASVQPAMSYPTDIIN